MASVAPGVESDSTQTCRRQWPAERNIVNWLDGQAAGLQSCALALCLCTPEEDWNLSMLLLGVAEKWLTMTTKLSRPERTLFTTSCTGTVGFVWEDRLRA